MALVDISKTSGVRTPSDEEVYLARHWNAVYEARRARDAQRHRPREEFVEITEPEDQNLEPEQDVYSAPGRFTTPERRRALTETALRLGGKRRKKSQEGT